MVNPMFDKVCSTIALFDKDIDLWSSDFYKSKLCSHKESVKTDNKKSNEPRGHEHEGW